MSQLLEYFNCPRCQTKTRVKHRVHFAAKTQLYYGCSNDDCRHHWQVLAMDGHPPRIVAESNPAELAVRVPMAGTKSSNMGCPSCGRYGRVVGTERRADNATLRRHRCPTDGVYYSCTSIDGDVQVTRRRPSPHPIENAA